MDMPQGNSAVVRAAFDNAVAVLTSLENSLQRCDDTDSVAKKYVDDAFVALRQLSSLADKGVIKGEEWLNRKRHFLSVVERLSDSSKLTALGTMQVEFSGMLRTIIRHMTKDDTNKVKKTEFDMLDSR